MKLKIGILAVAFAAVSVSAAQAQPSSECFVIHGRLQLSNGTPSIRIWRIGTERILGVPDGPPGDEQATLPANVRAVLATDAWKTRVFADFHVCPLTPDRPGEMQLVQVVSADLTSVER